MVKDHAHGLEHLILLRYLFSDGTTISSAIPITILGDALAEIDNMILKFTWK